MAKSLSCVCLLRQATMTVTYPTCNLGSAQRGEGLRRPDPPPPRPGPDHQGGLSSIKVVIPSKRGSSRVGLEAIKTCHSLFLLPEVCPWGPALLPGAGQIPRDMVL